MNKFRKAKPSEEDTIFSLYESVKINGKDNGTSDWDKEYPNREILNEDMVHERIFVLTDEDVIIGAISIVEGEEVDISPLK